jgi:hypothetical protein
VLGQNDAPSRQAANLAADPSFFVALRVGLKDGARPVPLDLPNGIPGKDVFRRVLMALTAAAFQSWFVVWLQSSRAEAVAATGVEQPVLGVDGNTTRRSHDRAHGLGALHAVTVWGSEYGLSLGQVARAEKLTEITGIPELLRLVDIGGAITQDRCDRGPEGDHRADGAREAPINVLALKGNWEMLHQAVIDYIDEQLGGVGLPLWRYLRPRSGPPVSLNR